MGQSTSSLPSPDSFSPGERFIPYKQFYGPVIPNGLIAYDGLSPIAKLAWGALAFDGGPNGKCYPSIRTLADDLGVSRRHAVNIISELIEHKFLARVGPSPMERGYKRRPITIFFGIRVFIHA